jgi:DNA mismatch endonuclease, patch repair protein
MADVFSGIERSQIMSKVKSAGNKATELRLIQIFREFGISGWRRKSNLVGKPDFVFRRSVMVVFVDGCFWHHCPIHGAVPASNSVFWNDKLRKNVARDKHVSRQLKASGWRVVRIWQHELREPHKVVKRLRRHL